MNLWETTLVNLQKGYDRMTLFAATFSDWVKAEINIVRLRMQIDEVRAAIRSEHASIGGKIVSMREEGTLPRSFDQFFKSDEIASSLDKLTIAERTLDDLIEDLGSEAHALAQDAPIREEETPA